jgi:iron complex outermembrane recepter protein
MMALPQTEAPSALISPSGAGIPDMRFANTHVMPEPLLDQVGPAELLSGFEEVLGAAPLPNGFLYHGAEIDVLGGSYGHVQGLAQAGQQFGNFSIFGAFGGLRDEGWQQHAGSRSDQFHLDLGYRANGNEFHLIGHYLSSGIKGGVLSPVQLIAADPTAQLNYPMGFTTEGLHFNLTGDYAIGNGWTAHSDFSFGKFRGVQTFTIGGAQVAACANNTALLCGLDGTTPYVDTSGNQFKNVLSGTDKVYAFKALMSTGTTSRGVTINATNHGELLGHPNVFTTGLTYNGGVTIAGFHQYLGTMDTDGGFGTLLGETDDGSSAEPQEIKANTNYIDVYANDILSITNRLKLAVGGRVNYAVINQSDLIWTSPSLNETRTYSHFSPSIGATYEITPRLIAYAGYTEAAHVLTPAGEYCDDPDSSCNSMPAWYAADTLLNQSVSHTYQLGLRGQLPTLDLPITTVQMGWNAGLYRTDTSDYYYLAPSTGRPTPYDVGSIRKQGIKLGVDIITGPLTTSIYYTYTDARFLSSFSLSDPMNSAAVGGYINVTPGKVMPGEPKHTVRVETTYRVTDNWSVAASLRAVSNSYYFGDEVNVMGKVPGYFVASFSTHYNVNDHLELFGIVENAFNKQYALFGSLVPTSYQPIAEAPGATDPHAWAQGQPRSFYAGFRYKF